MSDASYLLWRAGEDESAKPINREAVAFQLPAAIAYLQQLSKPAVPAVPAVHTARAQQPVHSALPATVSASMAAARQASAAFDGQDRAGEGPADAVRAFFAEQITRYMTTKSKAPQGMALDLM